MENYYKILGVETNATKEEIKRAYDSKIFKTDTVEKAYETLISDEKRKEFDKYLEEHRKKNYYELLEIEKTATTEGIIEAYYNIPEKERTDEITKAFNTLTNTKKRANYNIILGNKELKKEESVAFKKMVSTKLASRYDNYSREIYITKYQNKIEFIKKQIEIIQNEKDKKSFSYRIRISKLVTELEYAYDQLNKWMWGKGTIAGHEVVEKNGKYVLRQLKGKGLEKDFVSEMLSKSIEKIEETEKTFERKDVSTIQHIKLNIKKGFWEKVKVISSGSIKLYATTWSKIQDIITIAKPNLITTLKETEEELDDRLSKVVR